MTAEYESLINERNADKAWWSSAAAQQTLLVHQAPAASPRSAKNRRVLLAPFRPLPRCKTVTRSKHPARSTAPYMSRRCLALNRRRLPLLKNCAREAMRAGG